MDTAENQLSISSLMHCQAYLMGKKIARDPERHSKHKPFPAETHSSGQINGFSLQAISITEQGRKKKLEDTQQIK